MTVQSVANDLGGGAWPLVQRLVAADGSAGHRWVHQLVGQTAERRDLADAVHTLCMLHGRHPGMADDARDRSVQPAVDDWLQLVADGFAVERAALAALVSAAGPLPSTPGHAISETAILTQRHALAMLARSDRGGCATGAVAALTLDWTAIWQVLVHAGEVFGAPLHPAPLAGSDEAAAALALVGSAPGCERAIGFGAQQLLAQHRGLWDLLEARAEARR